MPMVSDIVRYTTATVDVNTSQFKYIYILITIALLVSLLPSDDPLYSSSSSIYRNICLSIFSRAGDEEAECMEVVEK